MPLPTLRVLLLLLTGWLNGISDSERIECTQHADCNSESLACCRNNICCNSLYHQAWRTKCFTHDDCKGIKDHFTKLVMNEHCCKSNECCSRYAYENEPDDDVTENTNGHTKFLIIVGGTLLASAILIATIVTFWCSSGRSRSRRRSFSRRRLSIYDTSPDDNCVGVETSGLGIDHEPTKPTTTGEEEELFINDEETRENRQADNSVEREI